MGKTGVRRYDTVLLNGPAVKAMRRARRLTQQDLAQRASLSRGYVGSIESRSSTSVGMDSAVAIADALSVGIEQLLLVSGPAQAAAPRAAPAFPFDMAAALNFKPPDTSSDTEEVLVKELRGLLRTAAGSVDKNELSRVAEDIESFFEWMKFREYLRGPGAGSDDGP